jgi:hypothetical protein
LSLLLNNNSNLGNSPPFTLISSKDEINEIALLKGSGLFKVICICVNLLFCDRQESSFRLITDELSRKFSEVRDSDTI